MKTPREILLARHRAVEPELDAIRQAVVDGLNPKDAGSQSRTVALAAWCRRCSLAPWRELILPSRRIWTGLAAIWILLFVINISQRDTVSSVTGQPVRSPAVTLSWQVQQRLMNDLLADRTAPPEADRPRNIAPRPRTEKHEVIAA